MGRNRVPAQHGPGKDPVRELTALADHLTGVENVHVAAEETGGEVTFLRTVEPGPTDRSYGIHVAGLAGVPEPVVDRSRTVLDRLREDKAIEARGGADDDSRQVVFDVGSGQFRRAGEPEERSGDEDSLESRFDGDPEGVLEELSDLEVPEQSPIELLERVRDWQRELNDR